MSTFDFVFAWEGAAGPSGPWSHLEVAELRGVEAISGLYRYDITLLAKATSGEVVPADLIGKRATLRIATLSTPAYKVVHGVIAEAREIGAAPAPNLGGMFFEIVLMPPLARARFRKRSRIFLEKTPRQIIDAVLKGDPLMTPMGSGGVEDDNGSPDYSPAEERFTWRVQDTSRLDDARVRGYCVQYNESDYDFIARILEDEGISYHFENGDGRCLLVLTDHDGGRPRLAPAAMGPGIDGREIAHFKLGARQRPGAVAIDDHNWKNPPLVMLANASGGPGPADLVEYVYPGGYPDSAAQGAPLAKARLERHGVEASYALGEGSIRVLAAGSVAALAHPKPRYEGEYVITELRVRGYQAGVGMSPGDPALAVPFMAEFECARRGKGLSVDDSKFRPARATPRPRIHGTQTAIVTAEPKTQGSEIHVGGPDALSEGCVRVRFHWDDESTRHAKEPTSCWVRVSQVFGGAGEGGVWHPRVGVEVIVDFEEGDPDRPIVTGRVYNGKNLPPYGGSPVHSTFKSYASPGGAVFNELTFDDSAGKELVFMNAGKDMTSIVGNNRLEDVASNAAMKVGIDNTEIIGANEAVTVGVNDTLEIGANDTLQVGANSTTTIGVDCTTTIGADQTKIIGASQTITVGSTLTEEVTGSVAETYGATRTTDVAAAVTETLGATRTVTVAGSNTQTYGGPHIKLVWGDRNVDVGGALSTTVNGTVLQMVLGSHSTTVSGTETSTVDSGIVLIAPKYEVQTPSGDDLDDIRLKLTGLSESLVGASASKSTLTLSLTGVSTSTTGVEVKITPFKLMLKGTKEKARAVRVSINGFWMHAKGFTCII